MKILRLSPYFYPEQVSSSHLTDDLNEAYAKAGFVQENYVPMPSRGVYDEIRKEYLGKKEEVLKNGSIIVHRFPMFKEGKNPIQRAFRYVLTNLIQLHKGKRAKDIDVILAASTPPTQGMLCAKVSKKLSIKYGHKVPFIYNLQDIFPDSLVNAGLANRDGILWKIGRKIEDYTYRSADKIIVISEGFKRNIMAKGVPEDKIVVVSNWINLSTVQPVERIENILFDEFNIERSKFVVVYAGNMGESQGADIIVDAAKELSHYPDIQFIIFGGGVKYQEIKNSVEAQRLNNIFITGLQPQERVSEVYSMGDVALITCKPGTGNAGLPSKTWSIMACNTPIIASFDTDSDLSDVLRDSGAGRCVEPGSAQVLAEEILLAYETWKNGETGRADIRDYVMKTASKEVCVQKYVDTLTEAIEKARME